MMLQVGSYVLFVWHGWVLVVGIPCACPSGWLAQWCEAKSWYTVLLGLLSSHCLTRLLLSQQLAGAPWQLVMVTRPLLKPVIVLALL